MSADPLSFLTDSGSDQDPLSFLSSKKEKSKTSPGIRKTGRLAAQYGIGLAETAALPYELSVAPLASKKAQQVPYREELFADIERLQVQKASGDWSNEDEALLNHLKEQAQDTSKSDKFVKTADIGVGKLAEKAGKVAGIDLEPEDMGESLARFGGNLISPKNAGNVVKKGASLLTKEGRLAHKWGALAKSSKGNPEKEGLLNFARTKSLSPEAATLLLQSKGKVDVLGKISKKTKKFKGAVKELNEKLGANYEELKKIGRQGGYLGIEESDKLSSDLTKILDNMGKTFVEGPDTKAARTAIQEALYKIENKGGTVEDLINSRANLSQGINWKNIDPKGEMLNRARNAFMVAIDRRSPKIAEDLKKTDTAWRKYKNFEKILDKKQVKATFHGVEIPNFAGAVAFAYAFGTAAAVKGLVAKELIQRLATKLIADPKYQGLHKRLINSLLMGSTKNQKEILTTIRKILKEDDPELYKETSDIIFD